MAAMVNALAVTARCLASVGSDGGGACGDGGSVGSDGGSGGGGGARVDSDGGSAGGGGSVVALAVMAAALAATAVGEQ